MLEQYTDTANALIARISVIAAEDPTILEVENPFDLFKYEKSWKVNGQDPTLFQISFALAAVKAEYAQIR